MTTIPRPTTDALRRAVSSNIAIVTGAAQGIGFATASLLAQHGARVVLVDIHEEPLRQACESVKTQSSYRICDVSDWDQQAALFQWVTDTLGPIHLVVYNAAINTEICTLQTYDDPQRHAQANAQVNHNYLAAEPKSAQDFTLKRPPIQIMDVNFNSVMFGLKLAVHHMKQTGGRVVVVASAASYLPLPSQPLYAASKHAVLGLARSTAIMPEVLNSDTATSCIAPWFTLTPMVKGMKAVTSPNVLKSSPEDVAWAIATTVERPASWANAKSLWVQGTTMTEVEGAYAETTQQMILPENRLALMGIPLQARDSGKG